VQRHPVLAVQDHPPRDAGPRIGGHAPACRAPLLETDNFLVLLVDEAQVSRIERVGAVADAERVQNAVLRRVRRVLDGELPALRES